MLLLALALPAPAPAPACPARNPARAAPGSRERARPPAPPTLEATECWLDEGVCDPAPEPEPEELASPAPAPAPPAAAVAAAVRARWLPPSPCPPGRPAEWLPELLLPPYPAAPAPAPDDEEPEPASAETAEPLPPPDLRSGMTAGSTLPRCRAIRDSPSCDSWMLPCKSPRTPRRRLVALVTRSGRKRRAADPAPAPAPAPAPLLPMPPCEAALAWDPKGALWRLALEAPLAESSEEGTRTSGAVAP